MNRQQFALVVALGLIGLLPIIAAGTAKAADWQSSSRDNGNSSTLSGTLYRFEKSGQQNSSAPYWVLDKWGVTRGYVAPAAGVDLESSVGQRVILQGTIRNLPGGDMPYMTCEKVINADSDVGAASGNGTVASAQPDPATERVSQSQTMAIREVVLESQDASSSDNSQNQYTAERTSVRHADPRRTRRTNGTAVAYQEPIPAPPPSTHMVHGAPEPTADPGPLMERSPAVSHGAMEGDVPMVEGPMNRPVYGDCGSCNDGESCGSCSPYAACSDDFDAAWGPHRPLFVVGPTGLWVKADYLLWAENGTRIPALVTEGSVNDAHPGALGEPGTTVLYGDGLINDEARSGFRFQAGMWLNRCCTIGVEGEYLILGDEESNFHAWSDGNPVLARPFNDSSLTPAQPRAELVAYPRNGPNPLLALDGSIDVNAVTQFHGSGARLLFVLCRQEGCWTDDCSCTTFHDRYRAIFTAGYRYLSLEDQLGISERLTTSSGNVPTSATETVPGTAAFAVDDHFNTQNTFNGGELGLKFEFQRNRFGLEVFPRVALGSTHSTVSIDGSTVITDPTGVEHSYSGGLLAQPTNIGSHVQNDFSVVPEIDLNLSYQLTPHAKFVAGYSFLYWNNVARAGEQIDTTVDTRLIPPGTPTPGVTTHPQFTFVESGFWAQGLNLGLDCRW